MSRGFAILRGGVADAAATAAAAEQLGYDAAWSTEFYTRSAVVSLAAMAGATAAVRIGSSIAYAVGRTPLVLATEARSLDELSGGRLDTRARHRHHQDDGELARRRPGRAGLPDGGADPAAAPTVAAGRGAGQARWPVLPRGHHAHGRDDRAGARRHPGLHRGREPADDRGGRPGVRRLHRAPAVHRPVLRRGGAARDRDGRRQGRSRPGGGTGRGHGDLLRGRRRGAGAGGGSRANRVLRRTADLLDLRGGGRVRRGRGADPGGVRGTGLRSDDASGA